MAWNPGLYRVVAFRSSGFRFWGSGFRSLGFAGLGLGLGCHNTFVVAVSRTSGIRWAILLAFT